MILKREKLFTGGGKLDLADNLVILGNKLRGEKGREKRIGELEKAMEDPGAKRGEDASRGHYFVPIPVGGNGTFFFFGHRNVKTSKDQLERERDRVKVANGDLTRAQFNEKWKDRELEGDTKEKREKRKTAAKLIGAGSAVTLAGELYSGKKKLDSFHIMRDNMKNKSIVDRAAMGGWHIDPEELKKATELVNEANEKIKKNKNKALIGLGVTGAGLAALTAGIIKHHNNRRGERGRNKDGDLYD